MCIAGRKETTGDAFIKFTFSSKPRPIRLHARHSCDHRQLQLVKNKPTNTHTFATPAA